MDDKVCRLEILRRLKLFYDGDPHGPVDREKLWRGMGGIAEHQLERNVKYLADKGLLQVKWFRTAEGFAARISSEGIDFLETGEPSGLSILSPISVHQEFHGSVGAVAGRDINVQITFSQVLNKLADAVQHDQKIPPEEKQSLIDRLRSLANNDWIRSIGTSVLADVVKKSAGI
jgi:hypothetical protein